MAQYIEYCEEAHCYCQFKACVDYTFNKWEKYITDGNDLKLLTLLSRDKFFLWTNALTPADHTTQKINAKCFDHCGPKIYL